MYLRIKKEVHIRILAKIGLVGKQLILCYFSAMPDRAPNDTDIQGRSRDAEGEIPSSGTILRCASCKGVAHPATGCQYSEKTLICRACTVRFWQWLKPHVNGKGRRKGVCFYDFVS